MVYSFSNIRSITVMQHTSSFIYVLFKCLKIHTLFYDMV